MEQRLIVTFSFKYREYLKYIRERQIERAEKIIERGAAGKIRTDTQIVIKQEMKKIVISVAAFFAFFLLFQV